MNKEKIIQIVAINETLYALSDQGSIYYYRPYLDEEKWTKVKLPDFTKVKERKEVTEKL